MIRQIIEFVFGCQHKRTTFPLTPVLSKSNPQASRKGCYVVCLDCGKEFAYDWDAQHQGSAL